MEVLFIENHHLVLAGAPKQLLSGTFREAFNQHLKGLSNVSTVALLRQLVLQIDHSLQTTDLLLFRHIIRQMFGGIGAWTFGILEKKSTVITDFPHQREGLLVIRFRLGMETTKQVGRNRTVGQDTTDRRNAV